MDRGKKPHPTHLKLVTGTFRKGRRRALDGAPIEVPPRPKFLKGRAAKIWDELSSRPLTAFQFEVLPVYASLRADYESFPRTTPTSRIVEMRRQAELLLAARGDAEAAGQSDDPADKYLDK